MTSAWTSTENTARIAGEGWLGAVDLRQPQRGVQIGWSAASAPGFAALAVCLPDVSDRQVCPLADHYLRGSDLVAAYGETPPWPLWTDVVWRAVPSSGGAASAGGIELVVSLRTGLLDSHPALSIATRLPTAEVLHLTPGGRFLPLALPAGGPLRLQSPQPGCLLVRLDGGTASYVEMVHPLDFRHTTLSPGAAGPGSWQVTHRLFPAALEKGVILRARLRGMLVPAEDDQRQAAELFAEFASSETPLATL